MYGIHASPGEQVVDTYITSYAQSYGDDLEIETKLGSWLVKENRYGKSIESFESSITMTYHERLVTGLTKSGVTPVKTDINSTSYSVTEKQENGTVIHHKLRKRNINYGPDEWEIKTTLGHTDYKDQGIRITVSREAPIKSQDDLNRYINMMTQDNSQNPHVRNIERLRFTFPQFFMHVDISKVSGKSKVYEVEIELMKFADISRLGGDDLSEIARKYMDGVRYVYKIYLDSEYLYTESERQELCKFINVTLYSGQQGSVLYKDMVAKDRKRPRLPLEEVDKDVIPTTYVDKRLYTDARSLTRHDLVVGGIIGGKWKMAITHKTDGDRCFLVIVPKGDAMGVWLVFPPYRYNLIYRYPKNDTSRSFGTMVLDGELIPEDRRIKENGAPDIKYWFEVIDVLYINGLDVRGKYLTDRRPEFELYRNKWLDYSIGLLPNNLRIDLKTIETPSTVDEFFEVLKRMNDAKPGLPYQDDGFIFTPINQGYVIYNWGIPSSLRCLAPRDGEDPLPDICKWKPQEKITIDFLIKRDSEGIKLFFEKRKDKRDEGAAPQSVDGKDPFFTDKGLFEGASNIKFDYKTMLIKSHPLTDNLADGFIVEYGWDYENKWLYPHRVRYGKSSPNAEDSVITNWYAIHTPIKIEDITGTGHGLMYKSHNEIKKKLYITCSERIAFKEEIKKVKNKEIRKKIYTGLPSGPKYLLDLGAGDGGDASKWKLCFDKIIAVEPDEDINLTLEGKPRKGKIQEIEDRSSSFGIRDRVTTLRTRAQDTSTIYKTVMEVTRGQGVDAIAIMNVMTFFWKPEGNRYPDLEALTNTIRACLKPGGYVIWMVMDGDAVKQIFRPALGGPELNEIQLGKDTRLTPEFTPDGRDFTGKLTVEIPGIVGKQVEWLTKMSDIKQILPDFSFPKEYHADKDQFLPKHSRILSSLYRYGMWQRKKDTDTKMLYQLPDLPPEKFPTSPTFRPSAASVTPTFTAPATFQLPPSPSLKPPTFTAPATFQLPPSPSFTAPASASSYTLLQRDVVPGVDAHLIPAIGDGTCLVHSVLTCVSKEYRDSSDKRGYASRFRRALAEWLYQESPEYKGYINWEITGRGRFPELYVNQIMAACNPNSVSYMQNYVYYSYVYRHSQPGPEKDKARDTLQRVYTGSRGMKDVPHASITETQFMQKPKVETGASILGGHDASPAGLFSLMDSYTYMGDESLKIISDALGIDIYVVTKGGNGITSYNNTVDYQQWRPSIVVVFQGVDTGRSDVGGHYDAVMFHDRSTGMYSSVLKSGKNEQEQNKILTAIRTNIFKTDAFNLTSPPEKDRGKFNPTLHYFNLSQDVMSGSKDGLSPLFYRIAEKCVFHPLGTNVPIPYLIQGFWDAEEISGDGAQYPSRYYISETKAMMAESPKGDLSYNFFIIMLGRCDRQTRYKYHILSCMTPIIARLAPQKELSIELVTSLLSDPSSTVTDKITLRLFLDEFKGIGDTASLLQIISSKNQDVSNIFNE